MSDGAILPVVRYADPQAAAQWLRKAYGFLIYHVAKRPDDGIAYIVVRFGENSVIIAPKGDLAFDGLMVQPAEIGNRATQACYLTVTNVDAHLARSRKAGAQIEVEPRDDDDGERFYVTRDLEGHLWSFGNALAGTTSSLPRPPPFAPPYAPPPSSNRIGLVLALLLGLALGSSVTFYLATDGLPDTFATKAAPPGMVSVQAERERAAELASKRLADAEASANDLTAKLQLSRQQFAEALMQKRSAEQRLSASESEYQNLLKDRDGALAAALSAKDAASKELEIERQRSQAIQTQLDEASKQLASQRTESGRIDSETQKLRATVARLNDSLLASTRAAEVARGQLADAQKSEAGLKDALLAREREIGELRARVAAMEADVEAARVRAQQIAEVARAEPNAGESAPRDAPSVVGSLPEHHLMQGKKWVSVAAVDKPEEKEQVEAPPPAATPPAPESGAASLCAKAVRELVFTAYRTSPATQARVVKRLCDRSHTTQEPAKCLSLVLTRKVSGGRGGDWNLKSAVDLCARTPSASTTISCFSSRIADGAKREAAIAACAAS